MAPHDIDKSIPYGYWLAAFLEASEPRSYQPDPNEPAQTYRQYTFHVTHGDRPDYLKVSGPIEPVLDLPRGEPVFVNLRGYVNKEGKLRWRLSDDFPVMSVPELATAAGGRLLAQGLFVIAKYKSLDLRQWRDRTTGKPAQARSLVVGVHRPIEPEYPNVAIPETMKDVPDLKPEENYLMPVSVRPSGRMLMLTLGRTFLPAPAPRLAKASA